MIGPDTETLGDTFIRAHGLRQSSEPKPSVTTQHSTSPRTQGLECIASTDQPEPCRSTIDSVTSPIVLVLPIDSPQTPIRTTHRSRLGRNSHRQHDSETEAILKKTAALTSGPAPPQPSTTCPTGLGARRHTIWVKEVTDCEANGKGLGSQRGECLVGF